ncbi:hypothetical protein BZA70DRAFT_277924 [Myxozyma melibiosi]|uniref:Vacuolar protein sorting-associated protein 17 n=1 Tax=Myxozyma melibiosi TaxID=54550 RepID=A0ABR1F6C1_9ASCO
MATAETSADSAPDLNNNIGSTTNDHPEPDTPHRPALSSGLSFLAPASETLFPDEFDAGFYDPAPAETAAAAETSNPLASTSLPASVMDAYADHDDGWGSSADPYLSKPAEIVESSYYEDEDEEDEDDNNPQAEMSEESDRANLFGSDDDIAQDSNGGQHDPASQARASTSTEIQRSSIETGVSSVSSTSQQSHQPEQKYRQQQQQQQPQPRPQQQYQRPQLPPQQQQRPSQQQNNAPRYDPQSYYKQEPTPQNQYYPPPQPAQQYPYAPQMQPPAAAGQRPMAPANARPPVMEYVLHTRVTGMERSGKKPPLIKFDAYTNLPRFRTTQFRDIRRTHGEFLKLFRHLCVANPECLVPTIPMEITSAGAGSDEDEYRIKANFQKWLDRVTSNPILMRDEEMMFFIEADFGYSPITKRKAPATGLRRKAIKQLAPPPDDCQELVAFRPIAKQFYIESEKVRDKLEKVSKVRRNLGLAEIELGHKFTNLISLEFQTGMINMWKKLGKTVMSVGDIEGMKTVAEMASLGDGLSWLCNDAYVVKETLTNRQILIRELISAQSTSRNRHATAARLRSSATINPLRVDEALNSLEEAKQVEAALTAKVNRVTNNLVREKREWFANTQEDLMGYMAEYVRRMIDAERRTLAVWESIRLDVRSADASGGLSRLGRGELPPVRRSDLVTSQGPKGDGWSGDRRTMHGGNGFLPAYEYGDDDDEEGISEVDAKNAAQMLAAATF